MAEVEKLGKFSNARVRNLFAPNGTKLLRLLRFLLADYSRRSKGSKEDESALGIGYWKAFGRNQLVRPISENKWWR